MQAVSGGGCQLAFKSLEKRWGQSPCLTWWPLTLNGLQHVSYPPRGSCLPGQTNCTTRRLSRVAAFESNTRGGVSVEHTSSLKYEICVILLKHFLGFQYNVRFLFIYFFTIFLHWNWSPFSVVLHWEMTGELFVRSKQMCFWGSCSKLSQVLNKFWWE